jgi:hypothetical protein
MHISDAGSKFSLSKLVSFSLLHNYFNCHAFSWTSIFKIQNEHICQLQSFSQTLPSSDKNVLGETLLESKSWRGGITAEKIIGNP